VSVGLDEVHIGNLLPKTFSDIGKVFGETEPYSPGFILGGLNDEGHDVGFIFLFGEVFRDFLE
jgi:hypothetical protein